MNSGKLMPKLNPLEIQEIKKITATALSTELSSNLSQHTKRSLEAQNKQRNSELSHSFLKQEPAKQSTLIPGATEFDAY